MFIPLCCFMLLYSGCREKQQVPSGKLKEGYEYVHMIPDSLRTPEQQQLCEKLMMVTLKYVRIVDNHFVFTLSKEEFLKLGIPKHYYDLMVGGMYDNNRCIDADPDSWQNVDSMWQETKKQMCEQYGVDPE